MQILSEFDEWMMCNVYKIKKNQGQQFDNRNDATYLIDLMTLQY